LGKGTGPATVPGNAITPHVRIRPIALAAIARLIVQRIVPPEERNPQARNGLRRDGPVEGRMADTSQGAVRGRTALAGREVAVEADAAVAEDGAASRGRHSFRNMLQPEGWRMIMLRNFKRLLHARRGAAMATAFVVGASLFPMALPASGQSKATQTDTRANKQLVFSSPEVALGALLLAFKGKDEKALLEIFGHEHEKLIVVTDKIARDEALERLYEASQQKKTLLTEGEEKRILILGNKAWPFPIPLVKVDGGWQFDTAQGAEEILNRRIGANELGVIDTCHAYVDAQEEYRSADRDGDDVLEYAQRLGSTEGKKDGLYWHVNLDDNQELSPFGPLLADAAAYLEKAKTTGKANLPFHGYYYRILTGQGAYPPGGEYKYVINGNMIAGFALVVCPADYGSSGIMTFLVSHQGKVYEKDLGKESHEIAKSMSQYNPDTKWVLVEDEQ
ncbi:MAG: DUF2950 domain-containing protein, partial [Gemmatimonadales bacterium]